MAKRSRSSKGGFPSYTRTRRSCPAAERMEHTRAYCGKRLELGKIARAIYLSPTDGR